MNQIYSRAAMLLFALATLGAVPAAEARIELVNVVYKVERFVDADGQVQRRMLPPNQVVPGDELHYAVEFRNVGTEAVDAKSVVITNPIPANTEYLDGTAGGKGSDIFFSIDSGARFGVPAGLVRTVAGNDGRDSVEPANARDYTTIRWVYQPALEPGETGTVSFNVRLK
ncbi:MAG: hypothetical protein AAF515_02755 [Pseudomonadota bacterium]